MTSRKSSPKTVTDGSLELAADVKKVGFMKKLKTMKKKFFVLREANEEMGARLEYYDNEKKFKNGLSAAKRSILLESCFSINRKLDAKHKYAFALYTRDECFAVVVDDENLVNQWLEALIELHAKSVNSDVQNITYDHVWQIHVNKNGLGQTRNMTGVWRLCLNANTLYIVKVDPQVESPDVYEFPLISIRRCGHTASTFFIELGRSSSIGPGELWIQAEDSTIAQNMHEVILNAMKSSKNHEEFGPSPRPRSASTSTSDKPISSRRHQTPSSLANQSVLPLGNSASIYCSTNTSAVFTPCQNSSIRERCDSMPSRSRTSSENESTHDSRHWPSLHHHNGDRFHSGLFGRTLSYSPPSNNPLSPSSGACSTDSVVSSISIEDCDSSYLTEHHLNIHNSLMPSEPPITEEETVPDDYLLMEPKSIVSSSQSMRSQLNLTFSTNTSNTSLVASNADDRSSAEDYLKMKKKENNIVHNDALKENVSPYMSMSPVASNETDSLSRRSSCLERNLNNDNSSSEYMSMTSGLEVNTELSDEYLNMAPLSASLPRSSNYLNDGLPVEKAFVHEEFHLEKVKSYFSPSEDSLDYIKPVRAYSIGSRPQLKPSNSIASVMRANARSRQSSKSGTLTPENEAEIRGRAFSMGSQENSNEKRIAAKKNALIESQLGAPNKPIEEVAKGSKKASSAPIISMAQPRMRSATVGSRPIINKSALNKKSSDSDLMEIDYTKSMQSKIYKEKLNEDKLKRYPVGQRQRSNSRSSTSSSGIGSGNMTSPSIASSLNELKEHTSNVYVAQPNKMVSEERVSSDKDISNDYLQVVISASNQEIKLHSIATNSTSNQIVSNQLSNSASISSAIATSKQQTKPNSETQSAQTRNIADDSGDYVCLNINFTSNANVPHGSRYTVNKIISETIPNKINTTILAKEIPILVPQYENVEIAGNSNNSSSSSNSSSSQSENISKDRPISCHLPEFKKQASVPNAINLSSPTLNFRKISCPSNLNQTSLSPLISYKRLTANNQQECAESKLSPDRNSSSSELVNTEELKSFQPISSLKSGNVYENVSLGSGSLSSSRPSSVSSERELNYASLDLAPCSSGGANSPSITSEERLKSSRSIKSPQLSLSGNTSSSSLCATPVSSLLICGGSQEIVYALDESSPLSYAEIDFKKSEGLKNTTSSARN